VWSTTQTDYATSINVYTNSQRTMREHADGLLEAYRARYAKMRAIYERMGADSVTA